MQVWGTLPGGLKVEEGDSFLGCVVGSVGDSLPSLTRLPSRNYGPTVAVQQEAQKKGCEQVLWLYGPDHQLTEVGTMNIFVYWTHEDGGELLVRQPTPCMMACLTPTGCKVSGSWAGCF